MTVLLDPVDEPTLHAPIPMGARVRLRTRVQVCGYSPELIHYCVGTVCGIAGIGPETKYIVWFDGPVFRSSGKTIIEVGGTLLEMEKSREGLPPWVFTECAECTGDLRRERYARSKR